MVELTLLKEGDSFKGAMVRLEDHRARICGKKLAFFRVRQSAPIQYNCCCCADDEHLIRHIKSIVRRTRSQFFVISGTIHANHEINITSVDSYYHGNDDQQTNEQKETSTPLYHRSGININPARQKVLQESNGELLRLILEIYIPLEDVELAVTPVNQLFASIGWSILHSSCERVQVFNLERALYDIFQSARHVYNFCSKAPFQDQDEYVNFTLAGAHLCELSLRRGNKRVIRDVYVRRNVVDALRLLQHQQRHAGESDRPATYSDSECHFLRAACIQLSKLDMNKHQDHIERIGYALHNHPHMRGFSNRTGRPHRWATSLEDDGILCQKMRTSGMKLYGLDWLWRSCCDVP